LHSYHYAWAEWAKTVGYAERFAQETLGHNRKAVHRACAKRAPMKISSLQECEEGAAQRVQQTSLTNLPRVRRVATLRADASEF
jgi:hypothetical protein